MSKKVLKIGQLAEQTGLTVRTLHWYDEIGLLKPSQFTESRHRLYSSTDIARLQQIKSLQDLGFSLKEIQDLLTRPGFNPEKIISNHLELLNERIETLIRLQQKLQFLASRYRKTEEISIEDLLKTIKEITHMQKYYSPEQLNKLKQRKEMLGEEKIQSAEAEWKELFEKYKTEMEKGTDPAAESVQKLAKRSLDLIAAFTGGDPGIQKSLGRMYQQEGGPNVMAQKGVQLDPDVWEYMGKAMSLLKKGLSL